MSPLAFLRVATTYVLSFGMAKGLAFLSALMIPRLVDARTYGAIEFAMTVGILVGSTLSVGVPAASARLFLIEKDQRPHLLMASSCLWVSLIGLGIAVLVLRLGYDVEFVCSAAILGLYAFQLAASAYTRMKAYIHFSGWFDNAAILTLCAVLLVLKWFDAATFENFTWVVAFVSVAVAISAAGVLVGSDTGGLGPLLRRVLLIGLPILMFGTINQIIFGTIRIAIERALDLSDVAAFALCARVTVLLVFLRQVLETAFVRHLYVMAGDKLGPLFSVWLLVMAAATMGVALAGHYFPDLIVLGTAIPAAKVKALFPLVTVQTALWSLNSNLEMFTVRDLLSRQAATASTLVVAGALVIGLMLHSLGVLNLALIVNIYSGVMATALIIQMVLLSRKGMRFGWGYLGLPLVGMPLLVTLLP